MENQQQNSIRITTKHSWFSGNNSLLRIQLQDYDYRCRCQHALETWCAKWTRLIAEAKMWNEHRNLLKILDNSVTLLYVIFAEHHCCNIEKCLMYPLHQSSYESQVFYVFISKGEKKLYTSHTFIKIAYTKIWQN